MKLSTLATSLAIMTSACSSAQVKENQTVDTCGVNARLVTGIAHGASGQVTACLNNRFKDLDALRDSCGGLFELQIEQPQNSTGPGIFRCPDLDYPVDKNECCQPLPPIER